METKKQVSCNLSTPTQNLVLGCESLHTPTTSSTSWFFNIPLFTNSVPGVHSLLLQCQFSSCPHHLKPRWAPLPWDSSPSNSSYILEGSSANSVPFLTWETIIRSNMSYPAFPEGSQDKRLLSISLKFYDLRDQSKGIGMANAECASCWLKTAAGNPQVLWQGVWRWQQLVWEQPSKTSRSTGHTHSYQVSVLLPFKRLAQKLSSPKSLLPDHSFYPMSLPCLGTTFFMYLIHL